MILLETVDLRKQFGETKACDGLNFVVSQGEFLSLVGSNGAGKTSLVNLISGQLRPDSGRILFEGRDVTDATVSQRIDAGIARSFQIANLFDGLSVFDNVSLSIFSREGKIVHMSTIAEHDHEVRREVFCVLGEFGLRDKAEALAGGPLGKVRDGDLIEIVIDRNTLEGSVNVVSAGDCVVPDDIEAVLRDRPTHAGLAPHASLPDDTRLWAALQRVSGGTWAGCVYDVDRIVEALEMARTARVDRPQ